ncbi:Tweety-like protein [Meloidogyne graminicola]|uniref:Protein tweety homolog n=1 Tax=Meloidogyne graminicola TaxID=189291 RepID=A0A8S9ZUT3_9BILA|nr:Tweety-like protein [Meloidogyne graminicola]
MSGRNFADQLLLLIHNLPHFDFRFNRLRRDTPFDIDPNGEYMQSLVIFCAFGLALALLFLLATVIVWVAQCCFAHRSNGPQRNSRKRIDRLSLALFVVSVLCFSLMGACLFGNEVFNKSVQSSLDGLGHLADGLRRAYIQTQKLNNSQWQLNEYVDELTVLIERKSRVHKNINQTQIREADALLTELSDKIDELRQKLIRTAIILTDIHFLETTKRNGERIEFERWLLCLLLQLIMCAVLFAGVIAFCRQSRKGAIIFSGLGLVIFLVSWLLFSAVFPLTVSHADFCSDSRSFLRSRLNDELLDLTQFYYECAPDEGLPQSIPLTLLSQLAKDQAGAEQRLATLLAKMFNNNERKRDEEEEKEDNKAFDLILQQTQSELIASSRYLGALQFSLQCGQLHKDVFTLRIGMCRYAFLGSVLISAGLFFLGLTLFLLLMLVAKSWFMFSRLPNDYLEVGEEDQFSPRIHDTMPDNIYDTNLFNPRARQHLGGTDGGGNNSDRIP